MQTTAFTAAALSALLALSGVARGQDEPAPRAPRKASIAVMPFGYAHELLHRAGAESRLCGEKWETSAFTNKFVTALVKTRKFDVVERQKVDRLIQEMELGDAGFADPARAVKAGRMIGADYFLMGEISLFTVMTEWKAIPYTERHQRIRTINVVVDMRIVDTRTSRIVAADTGRVRHVEKTMYPSRFNELRPLDPEAIDHVERVLCEDLTIKTIDGVYPIKIISSADGVVSLNRGEGGGLEAGTVLEVFAQGEAMVDPDMGEVLGYDETKIGRLQVSDVLAKFSKAHILAGGPFPNGAICRRAPEEGQAAPPSDQGRVRPPGWK